jgi:hypothetical protein
MPMIPRHFLVAAAVSLVFLWLWPQLYWADAAGIHAGYRSVWSDFAAHLTFAQRFARFPPELWFAHNPLFHGVRFDYPFVTGLISGGLLRLTGSELLALLLPTMAAAAVLPWVILAWLRTAGVAAAWASAGILIFYLAGGLGWTLALSQGLAFPPVGEASMVQDTWFRFSRLLHLLIPQRALQLGLPVGLLVIIGLAVLIRHAMARDGLPGEGRRNAGLAFFLWQLPLGIAAGLVYAIHVHSFIAVAVATATMVFGTALPLRSGQPGRVAVSALKRPLRFLPFAVSATLVSVGLLYWSSGGSVRHGFLQWDAWWLANDLPSWLALWWSNTGVLYALAAYALFTPRLWRSRFAASAAVAGWILFAIVNLVRLQPWDWDNTKLEVWAFVLLLPGVLILLQSWWQAGVGAVRGVLLATRLATLVVVLSLVPTGVLDFAHLSAAHRHAGVMWTAEQRTLAERFRTLMSPGEVTLVAERPHEWVSGLAGGQTLLGYTGWLWSYGIAYGAREQDLRVMFRGGAAAEELLRRYQVSWAVIDDDARRRYRGNESWFAERFPVVLQQGGVTVYDLRPDPAAPGP